MHCIEVGSLCDDPSTEKGSPHPEQVGAPIYRGSTRLEAVGEAEAKDFTELNLRASEVARLIYALDVVVVDKVGREGRREELVNLEGNHHIPVHVDVAKVGVVGREEGQLR